MDRLSLSFIAAVTVIVAPVQAASVDHWQSHINEASKRFEIPASWIRAVITAESNGDRHAVSRKGAMGLMQLMPGTWKELSDEHDLGSDPFDPRANIMAGTAYLKAMYDRFGHPGLFAAYHAGPTRYDAYLRGKRRLPRETQRYLVNLAKTAPDKPRRAPSGDLFVPLTTPLKQ
ncbi:lytic transglycosylase domain-containing protein [Methyloceanibacter sp.]|uniref:lytic transglycosylase domain-containing protein n=1 Tax=Methyloceanibacter sp. TaxID=1965321 RepID=UPI002BAB4B46|nr:lytic transglycosylase domain-containing protein [Methyloceanibacter sp.]HML92968.1 lytic transglycosylase domain-containing protein [Methyloceanibacter sp.]